MKFNESGIISTVVAGAISQYLRVKTLGALVVAGATDRDLGTIEEAAFTAGDDIAVRTYCAPGSRIMVANGAISADADVFAAAAGKVASTGTIRIGRALTAATADNDFIEVLPERATVGPLVEPKTANYTVTAAESGKTFTTVGAAAVTTFSMPAATLGTKYRFRVGAAFELRIDPNGTEVIALPSTGVAGAAGKYLTATVDGATVDVECTKAGTWSVFGFTGTWTMEP